MFYRCFSLANIVSKGVGWGKEKFGYVVYTKLQDIVWGNCGETNATKLQKLQNRAARVLTHSSFDAEAGPLLSN